MSSLKPTWTSSEDEILLALVNQYGEKKWCKISTLMQEKDAECNKTGKQCRERWHNHLNPSLKKEAFTLQDEIRVFEFQRQYGNKWSLIAENFEGRNDNFIKNCFYSAIRRNLRKYNKKKVPSKQLKGTINSLLKNPKTRKILMSFPEHEGVEVERIKVEEKKEALRMKRKENEVKEPPHEIIVPQVMVQRGLPRIDTGFRPMNFMPKKNIDDITPILNLQLMGGIVGEENEMVMDPDLSTTPLALCKFDSIRTDVSNSMYALPEYRIENSFQHYFSPRNSQ